MANIFSIRNIPFVSRNRFFWRMVSLSLSYFYYFYMESLQQLNSVILAVSGVLSHLIQGIHVEIVSNSSIYWLSQTFMGGQKLTLSLSGPCNLPCNQSMQSLIYQMNNLYIVSYYQESESDSTDMIFGFWGLKNNESIFEVAALLQNWV